MADQLMLGIDPPTSTGHGRKPSSPKVSRAEPDGRDGLVVLEEWCDREECLIFLWGDNPHLCNVRTHSSEDPGLDRWVNRHEAEKILAAYGFRHVSHQIKKSENGKLEITGKVYRRSRG